MIRRQASGLIDIPDFLITARATKSKEIQEQVMNGVLGNSFVEQYSSAITGKIEEYLSAMEKESSDKSETEKAKILKNIADARVILDKVRGAKSLQDIYNIIDAKLQVIFRLDEEIEKASANTYVGDYGLADSVDGYGINLNVRLLLDEHGNLRSDWRGDLTSVILPHEITHTILDAIGKKAGIDTLRIGNSANEEIVDSIVEKNELGSLIPYRRIGFGIGGAGEFGAGGTGMGPGPIIGGGEAGVGGGNQEIVPPPVVEPKPIVEDQAPVEDVKAETPAPIAEVEATAEQTLSVFNALTPEELDAYLKYSNMASDDFNALDAGIKELVLAAEQKMIRLSVQM
jgi:hypothetical protein